MRHDDLGEWVKNVSLEMKVITMAKILLRDLLESGLGFRKKEATYAP